MGKRSIHVHAAKVWGSPTSSAVLSSIMARWRSIPRQAKDAGWKSYSTRKSYHSRLKAVRYRYPCFEHRKAAAWPVCFVVVLFLLLVLLFFVLFVFFCFV